MDDWRAQLRPATRTRNFNRILKTLKKIHSFGDKDALVELQKIAQNIEGKAYAGAATKFDYSRKITSKLRLMECKFHNTMVKSMSSSSLQQVPMSSLQRDPISTPQQTNVNFLPSQEEASAWQVELQPDSRQRIINKIMETLKKHLAVSGQEALHELQKIAQRFEEKTFTAATSQSDYLRKISLKMLSMEIKSQGTVACNIPFNQVGPSKSPDPVETSGWRAQLHPDSRQRIVNRIMETLKKHLPVSGQEGLHELQKIAQRFEEKIFTDATSQSDYLRKISLKMLTMETTSQGTVANNIPSNQVWP